MIPPRLGIPPRTQLVMGAVLVSLVALNGWVLSRVIDTGPVAPPPVSRSGDDPVKALASVEAVPSAERGGETVARVLFHPSRRPPKTEATAAGSATRADGELKLVGVLNHTERGWRALIRQDAVSDWYGQGDSVGPYRVLKIERERAVLEGRGRRIELALYN